MNRIFSNQKGGTLLCYVPDDKAAPGIGAICALLKIKYREVGSEALDERIGALVSGKPQSAEAHRARAHAEPFVLFCGFSGTTLDAFLAQTRKQKIRLPLKAALTETNAGWTLRELYDAIRAEHETMTGEVL